MVKIAILDDNDLQRDILAELMDNFRREGNDIGYDCFSDGLQLIESVKKNGAYDVYLLDVVLPGMNGMEVATTLRHMRDDGKIIFLTASLEYAAMSYDVDAFYYLLKPVDVAKLYKLLERIMQMANVNRDSIRVSISHGEVDLPVRQIVYAELVDRVIRYHLADGRVLDSRTIRNSFKQQTSDLARENNFAYLGVSYLVNLSHVDAIDSESVLFRDGSMLMPPKSAYKDFKLAWKNYHLR